MKCNEQIIIQGKMKFNNITGKWEYVNQLNGVKYTIIIERKLSGAFAYGDGSCHTLKTYNDKDLSYNQLFDTRYEQIPTDKEGWINFWEEVIKDNFYVESLKLLDYNNIEIEVEDI